MRRATARRRSGRDVRLRRTACAALAAATVAAGLADAARAATTVDMKGDLGPVIRKFPRHPVPLQMGIHLRLAGDEPGGLPPILDKTVMRFPFGSRMNGALFPSCTPKTVNRKGPAACPNGSEIGHGSAVGVGADVVQKLELRLFNGPRGKSVVFFLRGNNPLRVNVAFPAPLRHHTGGRYEYDLAVDVPRNLQRVAGVDLALRDFDATVDATRRRGGRRRGYIETVLCPPGALVPFAGDFIFLEAPRISTDSYLRCG
jgi:hypothetical protein